MDCPASPYVLSFQTEHFHKGKRYHWMVCGEHKPDELVSWGYAPTQEQAETAAQQEVRDLLSGDSKGGLVTSTIKAFTRRRTE
jgi:hypothetical protein